jgi:diguanylate cyclase (GGDEF)-like protein
MASHGELFERVGNAVQIPDGVVTGLVQDKQGLIWIATTEGLIRFDGYRFRRYVAVEGDDTSLPGNLVRTLLLGRDGRLWVGTEADGVAAYDPKSDRFMRFAASDAQADRLPEAPIRALAEDASGNIWVGTTGAGLARLDPASGQVQRYTSQAGASGSLPDDRVSALFSDRDGTLWVGSWRGLSRWRKDTSTFELVLSDLNDDDGFANTRIRSIVQMSSGDLWVGAQQGQVAMIPAALLSRADPPQPSEVRRWRGNGMSTAAELRNGEVWVGHSRGIDVFRGMDATLLREIRPQSTNPFALDAAEIRAFLVDRSGLLWVGSFGGGLQRLDPREPALISRRLRPEDGIASLNTLTLSEGLNDTLLLGVGGVGVVRMDSDLRIVEMIPPGASAAYEGDQPAGIAETADGQLWLATERGLFRRGARTKAFVPVQGAGFLEGASVRRLWPHPQGGLWVGTADGLFRVTAEGRQPTRVAMVDGRPLAGAVDALVARPEGGWWVGGGEGLLHLAADGSSARPIQAEVNDQAYPLDIDGLLVDRTGQLWIEDSGLYRVSSLQGTQATLEPITEALGWGSTSFGANLVEDAEGRIWTHRAMYSPAEHRAHVLDIADGARVGTGWFRAFARMPGGRFAFGAREGVLVVTPSRFVPWSFRPTVVITELRIDGVVTPLGAEQGELLLPKGARDFSLEFSALDYSGPHLNRYRYRMLGVDSDWVESSAESRVASYGNLWPGTYIFEVEGSNRTGLWSEAPLRMLVHVQPRWWQTLWAALGGVAALALLVWLAIRFRTARLRKAREDLEAIVSSRTAELRALSAALAQKTQEFEQASLTDPLTGLRNRRYMGLEMASEMALWMRRAARGQGALAASDMVLFIIDIDFFKSVNDRHGHAAGDALLRQFSDRLRDAFRASDHLVRWGGEEFLIVARETDRERASELAERVRSSVSARAFQLEGGIEVAVTCSIGFAPLPWDSQSPEALGWESVVELADLALYTAKQTGRDAWVGLFPDTPLPAGAELRWVLQRLPRLITRGEVRLCSNVDLERAAHLLASQPAASAAAGSGAAKP